MLVFGIGLLIRNILGNSKETNLQIVQLLIVVVLPQSNVGIVMVVVICLLTVPNLRNVIAIAVDILM
jgi:hypothetical protein